MNNTKLSIEQQAIEAATYAVVNPSEFPNPDNAGHALVGALAAGATKEEARQIAVDVHMNLEGREQVHQSLYFAGALGYLTLETTVA